MGLMRDYKLTVTVNGKCIVKSDYFTEDSAICDMLEILHNNLCLRFAENGVFRKTETPFHPDKVYYKNYELETEIPPMKIVINKKSRGDFNQAVFLEKINMYRGRYDRKNY